MRYRLSLLVPLLIAAHGCGGGGTPVTPPPPPPPPPPPSPAPVATVSVTPWPSVTMIVGGHTTLTATPRDASNNALTGRTITWSTTAPAIATVDGGNVHAVAPGSATIRATSEGKSGEVTVTVSNTPIASITFASGGGPLVPGQTLQLTAIVRDGDGAILQNRALTWSTSGAALSVNNSGLVTALSPGSATITATAEGKSANTTIVVDNGGYVLPTGGSATGNSGKVSLIFPAAAVSAALQVRIATVASPPAHPKLIAGTAYDFTPDGTTFAQSVTINITYDAAAATGFTAANFRIHRWDGAAWQLLPGASVNTVTRVVTATTTSFSLYAVLEIPAPVATVALDPIPAFVAAGNTRQLTATLRDISGNVITGRPVTWGSSNTTIASISQTGLAMFALPGGPVTFTATSEGVQGNVTTTILAANVLTEAATGENFTCGLNASGVIYCWGLNELGQLGTNDVTDRLTPTLLPTAPVFASVYLGTYHTCALTFSGAAYCWGLNDYPLGSGTLGDGTAIDRRTPVAVTGGATYTAMTLGAHHTCGLLTTRTISCWGDNSVRQFGDGTTIDRLVPSPVTIGALRFTALVGGEYHNCALAENGLTYCWGENTDGQIGTGNLNTVMTPTAVSGGHLFQSLTAGRDYTCGLKANGEVWCWGSDGWNQGGDNTMATHDNLVPVQYVHGDRFTSIVAGSFTTCGITTLGVTKCWGLNNAGQGGNGTLTQLITPTTVAGGHQFVALVNTGPLGAHRCAFEADFSMWCWGYGANGQLGVGTRVDHAVPVKVSVP